ncbi:zinc finger MYM-type protein 1-like protein, partial [Tanacetum coccineum]
IFDIREALLQVVEIENDSPIQSQAKSLETNELGDFEFLVAIVIWFEILYAEFREMGLSKAINDAKQIAVEMDIDLVFVQKRVIHRKRQFD